jgi:cytoskeletal protein CcmA (bactofilin family)
MFPSVAKKNTMDELVTEEAPKRVMSNDTTRYNGSTNAAQSTYLAEDIELKGSLSFTSKLEFNGRFEGEIHAEGPLLIGEKALVKGNIQSTASVVVCGKVKGNISAKERVELKEMAQVYGDISSSKVVIREGAIFVGRADTLEGEAPSDQFSNFFSRLTETKKKGD